MGYLNSTIKKSTSFLLLIYLLSGCSPQKENETGTPASEQFKALWYAGKAEINVYDLKQFRYGEIHEGEATLIFVTEDFSTTKHVKIDNYKEERKDKESVLKLNMIKKFNTGIYPYSVMSSIFSPVNSGNVLKITMSSQEWCGQVFTQVDHTQADEYQFKKHSYFEREGEIENMIEVDFWEDELWNLIRINHRLLPEGTLRIVPSLFSNRTSHSNLKPEIAVGTLLIESEVNIHSYLLQYAESGRFLKIRFSSTFPHRIVSWEEGFTDEQDTVKTTARIKSDIFIDYWNRNKVEDLYLRDSLEIKY